MHNCTCMSNSFSVFSYSACLCLPDHLFVYGSVLVCMAISLCAFISLLDASLSNLASINTIRTHEAEEQMYTVNRRKDRRTDGEMTSVDRRTGTWNGRGPQFNHAAAAAHISGSSWSYRRSLIVVFIQLRIFKKNCDWFWRSSVTRSRLRIDHFHQRKKMLRLSFDRIRRRRRKSFLWRKPFRITLLLLLPSLIIRLSFLLLKPIIPLFFPSMLLLIISQTEK